MSDVPANVRVGPITTWRYLLTGVPWRGSSTAEAWLQLETPVFPLLYFVLTAVLSASVLVSADLGYWPTHPTRWPNYLPSEFLLWSMATAVLTMFGLGWQILLTPTLLQLVLDRERASQLSLKVVYFSSPFAPLLAASFELLRNGPRIEGWDPAWSWPLGLACLLLVGCRVCVVLQGLKLVSEVPNGVASLCLLACPESILLVLLVLGLLAIPLAVAILLIVPATMWWRERPRFPRGHCQTCGYDLTGNVSGICPECGEPI